MNSLKICKPLCCWVGGSWASLSQSYYSVANSGASLNKPLLWGFSVCESPVLTDSLSQHGWGIKRMGSAMDNACIACSTHLSVWTTFIKAKMYASSFNNGNYKSYFKPGHLPKEFHWQNYIFLVTLKKYLKKPKKNPFSYKKHTTHKTIKCY